MSKTASLQGTTRVLLSAMTLLLAASPIYGEIQSVIVKWRPGFCLKPCEDNLRKKIAAAPQVAESDVPEGASQATIRWKPNMRFSYQTLNFLIKGAGVKADQVFMTVRGNIQHDSRHVYLVSQGDGTRFTLLSPIYVSPDPSQSQTRSNVDSYNLSDKARAELLKNEQEHRLVTVKGLLLDPWRYVELYLIMDSHSVAPPLKKNENQR